ncbi:phosphoribosylglycinamide formyltransferase [Robiginitalea sp. M366]|uniref:phosphoribosylglycinamide formyltransferase n=1 Tax=Robiginitalea aestuariiviva TaxID=3036903 RepID=UPI00240DD624|nr:phosphoribosylglycinamide formyltransferase [Robiginitalea aestuariiviva]MDG1571606.1 phosphoribosylglycinamide formyltransferase [Robiginitalea aestuariiviva]
MDFSQNNPRNLVLFASGSGSNVERIATFFKGDTRVRIAGVLCNNPKAGVIDRCKRLGLPLYCFNRTAYQEETGLLGLLRALKPDLIVLAGFLWKIPESLIAEYPGSIVNIHPALLPKFGGRGMYGMHVHQAVVDQGETETGITIHHVNAAYDEGAVIFQARVPVKPDDTPEMVAAKVHQLEYAHYPETIQNLLGLSHG